MADGLIVLALGIWIGFWELLGVLSGAFFLSFFVAGFLFFFHKKNCVSKVNILFVPFADTVQFTASEKQHKPIAVSNGYARLASGYVLQLIPV